MFDQEEGEGDRITPADPAAGGLAVGDVAVGDVAVGDVAVDESPDALAARCRSRRSALALETARRRLCERELAAPHDDAGRPARDAAAAAERLAGLDWSELDGPAMLATVLELETARRRLDGAIAAGMAAVEATGASVTATGLVAHGWLAAATRAPRATGSRDARLGRCLGLFRGFAAAIAAGSLSIDHAAALDAVCTARTRDGLAAAEPELLTLAHSTTFEQFRADVRVIAARADLDGAEPDCADTDTLTASPGPGGEWHLRGRFSGHHAVVMERALRDETGRQRRAAIRDHHDTGRPIPPPAVLRARAIVELVRRGLAGDPATATAPRTEAILELHHPEQSGMPGQPHTPGQPGSPGGSGLLDITRVWRIDGHAIDDHTAAVLACDAWLQSIIVDADHNPLFAGRGVRYATPAQRRALILRDGGCVFPGCDAPPAWCDAHHVEPWEQGGPTDIDHLALLCRAHHGLAHSTHWTLDAVAHPRAGPHGPPDPDGPDRPVRPAVRLVWHTPHGTTLPAATARSRRAPPPDPTRPDRAGVDIASAGTAPADAAPPGAVDADGAEELTD